MVALRKADRLAARTAVDADGRTRYRGGKKGHPTAEANHAIDVRLAVSELEGAHQMLVADVAAMTPIERRENRLAAVGKIALAARALDDVLKREGISPPDCTTNRPPRGR